MCFYLFVVVPNNVFMLPTYHYKTHLLYKKKLYYYKFSFINDSTTIVGSQIVAQTQVEKDMGSISPVQ